MASEAREENGTSRGVDTLIAKLRDEGVAAGKKEADRIVADARAEAMKILDKAQTEARAHIAATHKEADSYRSAGEEAVKTAMRDTILEMKSQLLRRFSADVQRLASETVRDETVLKAMILELVGRVRSDAKLDSEERVELILPEKAAGLDEFRKNPAELQKGQATKYVLDLTDEMLREGLTFSGSGDVEAGIRIRLEDSKINIDVTDKAIASLLLQHLQPRFRAVLEGIVK